MSLRKKIPSASPSDPTIDATVATPDTGEEPIAGKIGLIADSRPRFSYETQCFLQRRLRAAAFIIFFGFGLFLLRRFFVETPLWPFHLTVVIFLGLVIAGLSRECQHSMRKLRTIELLVFGLPVLLLAAHQYTHMLREARRGDAAMTLAAMKSSVIYFFALIVVYGMFIPSTWRRTAMIVAPIAIVPAAIAVVLRVSQPEVQAIVQDVATPEQISDHVLMLLIGAVISAYGTHIINALRVEAFEAKQLGQYHLKQSIGKGGMGEVYLAEHQLLKRTCAIKLIRPDKALDSQALLRFEREVRTTAKLSHPNTIDIFDYGRTEDGVFFYVMEYLPGMDLADLVKNHGPLPPERAIHLLGQVCQALHEAHSIGFVHRDIKPGNIFAAHRGGMYDVAKVLDFGLVTQGSDMGDPKLTHDGAVTGSPLYMSPEQASGDGEPDARSDIYSLGCVAYYLLTGQPPFDAETPVKVMIAHARDQVLPPSKHVPEIPRDLEQVVVRCLAKEPHERFDDVESLSLALGQCQISATWSQASAAQWWREVESHQDGSAQTSPANLR